MAKSFVKFAFATKMVCRLCSGCEDLVDIFGPDCYAMEGITSKNVQITTGVKITPTDPIGSYLCSKCIKTVQRFIEYRNNCCQRSAQLKIAAGLEPEEEQSADQIIEKNEKLWRKLYTILEEEEDEAIEMN